MINLDIFLGMGLLWARDFEDLWEVHGSICDIYMLSPPQPPQHYKKLFCTLAVRCLHAFKLAGTNRLTTAAMNIVGLRIKTVCSNFEMFGHVLDNNLSFMLCFFEKHVA